MKKLIKKISYGMVMPLVAAFSICVMSSQAMAIPLAPGSTVYPTGTTAALRPELAGTIIVDELKPFTGLDSLSNLWFTGTLQVRIVKETVAGTLDFYYRIVNDSTSIDGIARLSTTDFGGWSTDVDYRTDGLGTIGSDRVTRQSSGSTVSFNFDSTLVGPGTESRFLFIKTTASNYKAGSTVLLDGGRAAVNSYAPAVPEPGTLLLLGTGLLGLGVIGRKRIKA